MPKWKISKDKDIVKTLMKISEKICEDLFFMQQSRFMAIMNDYDRTLQLVRTSTNSAGEANLQYSIYEQSVEAANNRLKNSFEAMYATILQSDALIWFYDTLSGIIDLFTELNPLVVASTVAIGAMAAKFAIFKATQSLTMIATTIPNMAGQFVALKDMAPLAGKLASALGLVGKAGSGATAGMVSLGGATMAATLPIIGIVAAISAAVIAFVLIAKAAEKAKNAVHEYAAEKAKAADESKSDAINLESLVNRYEELDKIINKTAQEQQEYNDIRKQLADKMPEMIQDIDSEGNFILKTTDALNAEVEARKANAAALEREAFYARMASMAKAEWDAEVSKGGAGPATSEQIKNVKKNIDDLNETYSNLANASLLRSQKTGEVAYNQKETFVPQGEAFETTLNEYNTRKINEFLEQGRTDTKTLEQELVQGFKDAFADATPKMIAEYEKQAGIMIKSIDSLNKIKNLELKKQMTSAYYGIGDSILSALEFGGEQISNEYKDLAASMSKDAATLALDIDQTQLATKTKELTAESIGYSEEDFKKLTQDQKEAIAKSKYGEGLMEGWIGEIEYLRSLGPEYDNALKTMTDLKKSGASPDELQKAFQQNFSGMKMSDELADAMLRSFYDPELFEQKMERIGKHIKITVGGTMLKNGVISDVVDEKATAELQNKLTTTFETLSQPLTDALTNAITSMDEGPAKQALLQMIPDIFGPLNSEFTKSFEDALAKVDPSDPTAIAELTKTLTDEIMRLQPDLVGGIEAAAYIAESIITQEALSIEALLTKTKESFDKLKKLEEDVKKSASTGFNAKDILEMSKTYGANAFIQTGDDTYVLSAMAVEQQRQKATLEYEKNLQYMMAENEKQIKANNDALNGTYNEFKDLVPATIEQKIAIKETNDELIAQQELYEGLLKASQKITDEERARMKNQQVITGATIIAGMGNELKDLGSLYDQVNEGMSEFQTAQAIAANPEYVAFLDETTSKLDFSSKKIKENAKATIDKALVELRVRKAAVKQMQDAIALQLIESGNSSEMAKIKEEQMKVAIKNYGAESLAQQVANRDKIDALSDLSDAIIDVDQVEQKQYENTMKRTADQTEAYKQLERAKRGDLSATTLQAEKLYGASKTAGAYDTTKPTTTEAESYLSTFLDQMGVSENEDERQRLLEFQADLENQMNGLVEQENYLIDAGKDLGKTLEEVSGKSNKTSGSIEKLNDSLEKNYNILQKINDAESDLDMLQSRIDLQSTGAEQDLAYLNEKAAKINELIDLQKDLIAARKVELLEMQTEKQALYGTWVQVVNGNAVILNQIALSKALMSGTSGVTQEFYDGLQKYVESYNDLSNSIRDTQSAIIDLQAQQEEMYDEIINRAIETRQQLYDAIIEADQKELESAREKFDQMTEMENEYLNAVKNAIDQERKAREDATKQEDLIAKKRRLAILQRETSGLYGTEIATLQKEIAIAQQEARDTAVDKQLTALEEQMKIQQEQRDLQMQMLEEQQKAREETGYYWDRVDDAIQNGPEAMVDLLTSTQEYQTADPLVQTQQLEQFNYATEQLSALIAGNGNKNVIEAIMNAARAIIENNIEEAKKAAEEAASSTSGEGDAGGSNVNVGDSTGTGATPSTTGSDSIRALQSFLNTYFNAGLKVDGLTGPKTKAATDSMLNKMILKARDYYGANSGYFLSTQGALLDSINNDKINSTAYSFIKKMFPGAHASMNGLKYKKGGVVDYTGPAWVDGTKSDPEAFLNAKQTEIFASLRDFLEMGKINNLSGKSSSLSASTSIGDIIINLQNPVNASADQIAALVKRDILNSIQNRVSMTIQGVR